MKLIFIIPNEDIHILKKIIILWLFYKMKQRHTIIFLPCLNFCETWNNKIQLHEERNINKFHKGFKRGGGGGKQIEWYNNNILSSNKTKMSNMRIKSFGGIHYLYLSISIWFSQKKNLLAFMPNVKILGSNMVSRNFENGSKNMKKKIHEHMVLKKKKKRRQ